MTDRQRAAAYQLAAALRNALPRGSFDEQRFAEKVLAEADTSGHASQVADLRRHQRSGK